MLNRIESLQSRLPQDVDGALITSAINRRYYTGMPSSAGTLLVTRNDALLLIDFRYIETAKAAVKGCRVELQTNLKTQLPALAKDLGLNHIALESGSVTLEQAHRLEELLPDARFATDNRLHKLMTEQRQIKSPAEIRSIEEAQRLSEEAFTALLGSIKPGRTERELALELEFATRRLGSEGPSFEFIVVGGPNSSRPHGRPGDRALQKGDLVTFDFGSILDGYCSDMTRTVAVGTPDPQAREIYDIVLRAQRTAIEAIGPGVCCADVDKAARQIIETAGYGEQFGHSTGHSVGLEVHESPAFAPSSTEVCQPGMVISVEPGIYVEGKCGCRIEDLVCITEKGCRNLNKTSKELIIL